MLSVIHAQQLHSYPAPYCQCSTERTPASSNPLHLQSESAASCIVCMRNCTLIALHNADAYAVSHALVPVQIWASICSVYITSPCPLSKLISVGVSLALMKHVNRLGSIWEHTA